MILRINTIALFATLIVGNAHSQNLVKNPSLEVLEGNYPQGWHMIAGTPDLATRHFIHVDLITRGFYNPFKTSPEGNNVKVIEFGDICLCGAINYKWSELTQVELIRPLKRKKRYQVSLYVIKATHVEPSLKEVSVYLSRHPMQSAYSPAGYQVKYNSLTSEASPLLSSQEVWTKVKGAYTAQGGRDI